MRRSRASFPLTGRTFATQSPSSSASSVRGELKTIKEVPGPPALYQIPYIGFAFHLKPFGEFAFKLSFFAFILFLDYFGFNFTFLQNCV